MKDYLVLISFWILLSAAVLIYIFTRRSLLRSRALLAFDCAILFLDAFLCVAFWWREISGHISQDVWLDEYGFLGLLVPMYATFISLPFLLIAGLVRRRIFSTVGEHVIHLA
ncbi:MAG: hypothetical protein QOF93_302 [Verrucomicrobiota bacterium]|jgi:hypothetical protein